MRVEIILTKCGSLSFQWLSNSALSTDWRHFSIMDYAKNYFSCDWIFCLNESFMLISSSFSSTLFCFLSRRSFEQWMARWFFDILVTPRFVAVAVVVVVLSFMLLVRLWNIYDFIVKFNEHAIYISFNRNSWLPSYAICIMCKYLLSFLNHIQMNKRNYTQQQQKLIVFSHSQLSSL